MIVLLLDTSAIGGIETHVLTLAEALIGAGHPAQIVCLKAHGSNPFHAQIEARGVPYCVLGGGMSDLVRFLKQERPHLVHSHGYKAGILGRLAARWCKIPVVSTFHAGEIGPFPINLYQWIDDLTSIMGERIAVSAAIRDTLRYGGTLISNFVRIPDQISAHPTRNMIGFVGRLSHEKAPDLFCEIARRISGHHSSSWRPAFHVFGDGPLRAALEVEYGAEVTFHGAVTDMAQVWAQLDLLVMPSRAEGLPMAALEALSYGIPIVASRVGALDRVVIENETGWLYHPTPDQEETLGRAIQTIGAWISAAPDRKMRMREAAHAHVTAHFSPEAQLPHLLAVYAKAKQTFA